MGIGTFADTSDAQVFSGIQDLDVADHRDNMALSMGVFVNTY